MTLYKRIDYGPNPHAGADRNNAQERGWGPGWPNCQPEKMAKATYGDLTLVVRREIAPLVATLMEATEKVYEYDLVRGWCWGFACRAIRGTETPSNHSWGLAVDLNAPNNPMQSTFRSDIPPPVVHMWEACGLYWGGRYLNRPDAMHMEYIGRPADVTGDLILARRYLAGPQGPAPDRSMSIWCLNAAGEGQPMRDTDTCWGDVKQFLAMASPGSKENPGMNVIPWTTWNAYYGATWTERAGLFRYAIKCVQAKGGLVQDGYVGWKTAAFITRASGLTVE